MLWRTKGWDRCLYNLTDLPQHVAYSAPPARIWRKESHCGLAAFWWYTHGIALQGNISVWTALDARACADTCRPFWSIWIQLVCWEQLRGRRDLVQYSRGRIGWIQMHAKGNSQSLRPFWSSTAQLRTLLLFPSRHLLLGPSRKLAWNCMNRMCQSHPLTDVASGRHNLISLDMLVFVILRSSFLHLSIFSKATYISPIFKEHGEMEVLHSAAMWPAVLSLKDYSEEDVEDLGRFLCELLTSRHYRQVLPSVGPVWMNMHYVHMVDLICALLEHFELVYSYFFSLWFVVFWFSPCSPSLLAQCLTCCCLSYALLE